MEVSMTQKKIAILGAGAIGSTIGGFFAKNGVDCTLIDMWPENVQQIRSNGLRVTTMEDEFVSHPGILHISDVSTRGESYDIVILSVKSYDTEWITHFIKPYLNQGSYVICAQNSINDDRIAAILGWTRVIGAVVTYGAGIYEPGHVNYTSPKERPPFTLGELNGLITPRINEAVDLLNNVSGGGVKSTSNLWGERWSKLCVNSMANAIAGVTGLKSAELREVESSRHISIRIAAEVVQVALANGVDVQPISGVPPQMFVDAVSDESIMGEVEGILMSGAKEIGIGRPSLAQDLLKGRKIEVDYLNGYVSKKGSELGIPTPVNDAIRQLAHRVARKEIEPSVENLQLIK